MAVIDNATSFVSVLDQGSVELQDLMGDDLAIVNAARVSFLGDSKGPEKDKKLLFYLMEHRHTGPFEQVEFKFRLHAPLIVWWQLVRHRTASLNLQSGRYTEFEEDCFYLPAFLRTQSLTNKQGSGGVLDASKADWLLAELDEHYRASYALYKKLIDADVAREQARLALPGFAVYYSGVWKIDCHNLMHFLSLRMAPEAQYEIRAYADAIYRVFKSVLPWTAESFEKYILGGSNGVG